MATINPIEEAPPAGQQFPAGVRVYKWTSLSESDTATPVKAAHYADKTVQVNGNFGAGGTVVLEGSLEPAEAPAAYQQLHDPSQNNISFTVAGVDAVLENVWAIRPRVSAGTGVEVDVRLLVRHAL